MSNTGTRRILTAAAMVGLSLGALSGTASAQDTSTTQLDVGAGTATTSAAPTRVEAGGGGTADSAGVPFTTIALAGAGVIVVGASAERIRRAAVTNH